MQKHLENDKMNFEGLGFTQEDWDEVSDNPELTSEDILSARPFAEVFPELAASIIRDRGRPKLETPKKQVTLRLDADIIASFKSGGKGWQGRMNDALRKAAGL